MSSLIGKLFKKESVVASATFILILTSIEKVIQIPRSVIFARVLGPVEYGAFNLAFFIVPLVVAISKLGLPSCYERYIAQYEEKGQLKAFLGRNYLVTIAMSLVLTIFFLYFSKQISDVMYHSLKYKNIIILCSMLIVPNVLYENLLASFNGLRVFKLSALLRFNQLILFSIIGIVLVLLHNYAESVVAATLVSFIVTTSIFGFIILKYVSNPVSPQQGIDEGNFYRKMFRYSAWFIVYPLAVALFGYTDRLVLNHFLGLREVGVYSVASNITQLAFMFGTISGTVLMPNLSNRWERGDKERVVFITNLAIKFTVLSVLVYAVIFVLFKNQIMSILYGDKFLDSLSVIPILLAYWLLHSLVFLTDVYSKLIEKPYISVISVIIGFVINLILSIILTPIFGMKGAAIAVLIGQVFVLTALFCFYKREKMIIKLDTIFVCCTPIILIFNNSLLIITSLLILLAICFRTNIFMTDEEKQALIEEVKIFWIRIRKRRDVTARTRNEEDTNGGHE